MASGSKDNAESISSSPLCLTKNLNRFCFSLLLFAAVGPFATDSLTKNLNKFWWNPLLWSLPPRPSVDLHLSKRTSIFEWSVRHSGASIIGSAIIPRDLAMQDCRKGCPKMVTILIRNLISGCFRLHLLNVFRPRVDPRAMRFLFLFFVLWSPGRRV